MSGIYWPADELAALQKGLYCMELVGWLVS